MNLEEIERQLQDMECPFTWDMERYVEYVDLDPKLNEEDSIPLLKLFRTIMGIYIAIIKEGRKTNFLTDFEKCDEVFKKLQNKEPDCKFSLKIVNNVIQTFKCHVYVKIGEEKLIDDTFKQIKVTDKSSDYEKSTLDGLKSMCWSYFQSHGIEQAIMHIRKALHHLDKCAIFHFILAKNLRRIRRGTSMSPAPSSEECNSFKKASSLEPNNLLYALYVAQNYRESNRFGCQQSKTLKLHKDVLRKLKEQPPEQSHSIILLRLSLGFIRLKDFSNAEYCLKIVEKSLPEDPMFLHYKGIFHMKNSEYEKAAHFMLRAAVMGNSFAAREYLKCVDNFDPQFNSAKFLVEFVQKTKLDEKNHQTILCDIAICYMKQQKKHESFQYFLEAVKLAPDSGVLTQFQSAFEPGKSLNIFKIIQQHLDDFKGDRDEIEYSLSELQKYCKQYSEKQH